MPEAVSSPLIVSQDFQHILRILVRPPAPALRTRPLPPRRGRRSAHALRPARPRHAQNTNIDGRKKIMFAVTSIKGVGRRFANIVCKKAAIDITKR